MIRLAIVGTGNMANTHANEFNKIEGVKIVAACDISKKNVEEFAGKHKIKKTLIFNAFFIKKVLALSLLVVYTTPINII